MGRNTLVIGSIVAFILLAESILTGFLPHSRGFLFELLEAKAGPIWLAIGLYFSNYLFLEFFQSVKAFMVLKFSLIFRTLRSKKLKSEGVKKDVLNTPQRIQEDIKLSYHSRITVWCEYFISGTILVQLVLLNLSEPVLVIASLVYAIVSVVIAYLFNPRLNYAEKLVQEKEASYREGLVGRASDMFGLKVANQASLRAAAIRMQYFLFTKLQFGLIHVLPYIVLVPKLLAGDLDLGEVVKHQATFALIVVNAAILIQYYTLLVQGKASEERVKELEK